VLAAVYHGVSDLRLEEVEEPTTQPGHVKLRVAYNGLCGTDLHEVFDSQRAIPSEPHPLTGAMAPLVLGHEIGGTVVELGEGVADVQLGSLVAVEPLRTCGVCRWCRSGDRNLCNVLAFHGLSTGGGGLAEFTVVPREMVHVVPKGIGARDAAMAEPLAVAWHAVDRSGLASGDLAVVLGGGPIGIGIFLTLRLHGIDSIVVEPSKARRDVARRLGAEVIDPADGPVDHQLRGSVGGGGVRGCFETSATVASLEAAIGATAKHGTVMLLASPRQPLPPILGLALAKELEVRTSYGYRGDFPEVLDAIASDAYRIDEWTVTAGLTQINEVLHELRSGRMLKVLIDPSA
jgi:(R,R)-butanediol dehydrogenase / meso-butanediol dehydrogenase / diacetyl reductase